MAIPQKGERAAWLVWDMYQMTWGYQMGFYYNLLFSFRKLVF